MYMFLVVSLCTYIVFVDSAGRNRLEISVLLCALMCLSSVILYICLFFICFASKLCLFVMYIFLPNKLIYVILYACCKKTMLSQCCVGFLVNGLRSVRISHRNSESGALLIHPFSYM